MAQNDPGNIGRESKRQALRFDPNGAYRTDDKGLLRKNQADEAGDIKHNGVKGPTVVKEETPKNSLTASVEAQQLTPKQDAKTDFSANREPKRTKTDNNSTEDAKSKQSETGNSAIKDGKPKQSETESYKNSGEKAKQYNAGDPVQAPPSDRYSEIGEITNSKTAKEELSKQRSQPEVAQKQDSKASSSDGSLVMAQALGRIEQQLLKQSEDIRTLTVKMIEMANNLITAVNNSAISGVEMED